VPELNAIVTQRIDFNPGLMILRVARTVGELPPFKPGSSRSWGFRLPPRDPPWRPRGACPAPDTFIRRAYSIASASHEKEYLEFYIVLVTSGALTPRLFALNVGDRIFLSPKATACLLSIRLPRIRISSSSAPAPASRPTCP